jgi:hypothetical protein
MDRGMGETHDGKTHARVRVRRHTAAGVWVSAGLHRFASIRTTPVAFPTCAGRAGRYGAAYANTIPVADASANANAGTDPNAGADARLRDDRRGRGYHDDAEPG